MLESSIRRVAILFAGGPAPAANAVISTAAVSFLRNNIDVVGILHGYSHLMEYAPGKALVEGKDYIRITHETLEAVPQQPGHHHRHRAGQPGQAGLRSCPSPRRRADRAL